MADKEIVESLNKISGNLEEINKTLMESKQQDKPTADADVWKKRIENLIEKVDHECKKRSQTPQREFQRAVIVIIYSVAFVGLFYEMSLVLSSIGGFASTISIQEEQLKFLVEQLGNFSTLSVAVIAVELSFIPVILAFPKTSIQGMADYYYNGYWWRKGLSKGVPEADRPYLKALINMKCKEFDLTLAHIYHSNPNLFSEESLLKSLYN